MTIKNIETPYFNRDNSYMVTFELIDGDRIALNHVPSDICDLYYSEHIDNFLSFVIFDMKTLEEYSFALLKPSNLNDREKGVEIMAIGYNNHEAYNDLLEQMKFHVFRIKKEGNHLYNYLWAKNTHFFEYMAINVEGENCIIERGNNCMY